MKKYIFTGIFLIAICAGVLFGPQILNNKENTITTVKTTESTITTVNSKDYEITLSDYEVNFIYKDSLTYQFLVANLTAKNNNLNSLDLKYKALEDYQGLELGLLQSPLYSQPNACPQTITLNKGESISCKIAFQMQDYGNFKIEVFNDKTNELINFQNQIYEVDLTVNSTKDIQIKTSD